MQKQTFKLPKQLALGFAALVLVMTPSSSEASYWSFMGKIFGGYNFFGIKKPKITGVYTPNIKDKKIDLADEKAYTEPGEIETEPENFMRALDIGIGFSAIYKLTDMFGIGGILDLGISFSKEQWKSWKSLTLSEAFVAKAGIALSVTDWVMIAAGVRLSYLTLDVTWTDDDKASHDSINKDPKAAITAGTTKAKNVILFDTSKNYSNSQWTWGLFLDFNLLIPVTENLRFIITAGVFGDVASPEFKDMFKDMSYVEDTNGLKEGDYENSLKKKTFSPKLENRIALRFGIGLGYQF